MPQDRLNGRTGADRKSQFSPPTQFLTGMMLVQLFYWVPKPTDHSKGPWGPKNLAEGQKGLLLASF